MTYDEDKLDRIVREIITPVDVYIEGEGPEGPWHYRSLTVRRKMNDIHVYDVDGQLYDTLRVPDGSREDVVDDMEAALKSKLEQLNEESLDEL